MERNVRVIRRWIKTSPIPKKKKIQAIYVNERKNKKLMDTCFYFFKKTFSIYAIYVQIFICNSTMIFLSTKKNNDYRKDQLSLGLYTNIRSLMK